MIDDVRAQSGYLIEPRSYLTILIAYILIDFKLEAHCDGAVFILL